MSKYTTQIRFICETEAGLTESVGYTGIDDVIAKSRRKIFDFNYPMYAGEDRSVLETKILMHYYTREIGLETYGLWKHFLKTRLNEIMPYYVALWENNVNSLIPNGDIDYYEAFQEDTKGRESETRNRSGSETENEEKTAETSKSGTTTTLLGEANTRTGSISTDETRTPDLTSRDRYSETPQGGITGVENDTYLTDYRKVTEEGTETNEKVETFNQLKDQKSGTNTQTIVGSDGTTEDINRSRNKSEKEDTEGNRFGNTESLLHRYGITDYYKYLQIKEKLLQMVQNIDVLIIRDLKDLFMTIY